LETPAVVFENRAPRFLLQDGCRLPARDARAPITTQGKDVANYPPNCPPTNVFLVLKLKFYTKIFAV
jgi:hypothetical protein